MSVQSWVEDSLHGMQCARRALAFRGAVWPFFAFAGAQLAVIGVLAGFTAPVVHAVGVPLVRFLGGERALHYPMHYVLLPGMFEILYLGMLVGVGFPLFVRATRGLTRGFLPPGTRTDACAGYGTLVLAGLIYVVAAIAGPLTFGLVAGRVDPGAGATALRACGMISSVLLQSVFVYMPVAFALEASDVRSAVGESIRWIRSRTVPTLFVLALVALANMPAAVLLDHADRLVLRFSPEVVLYMLVTGVLIEAVTAYFLFSALAGIAVARRRVGW